jgi:hypothetical protein
MSSSVFKMLVNEKSTIGHNRKRNEQAYSAVYVEAGQELNPHLITEQQKILTKIFHRKLRFVLHLTALTLLISKQFICL